MYGSKKIITQGNKGLITANTYKILLLLKWVIMDNYITELKQKLLNTVIFWIQSSKKITISNKNLIFKYGQNRNIIIIETSKNWMTDDWMSEIQQTLSITVIFCMHYSLKITLSNNYLTNKFWWNFIIIKMSKNWRMEGYISELSEIWSKTVIFCKHYFG